MAETVRGGRYLVGGQWVDANGQPAAPPPVERDARAASRDPEPAPAAPVTTARRAAREREG